jgi:hypothetical protein
MPQFLLAISQLLDFGWKAMKAYAQTPEGQAELADVIQALEGDEDPDADNVLNQRLDEMEVK